MLNPSLGDRVVTSLDDALRTLFGPPVATRADPAVAVAEPVLTAAERRCAARLMRVNHSGEVAAQALYRGQAEATKNSALRANLHAAAREETEHLAWCSARIEALGGRPSVLNPLWYASSYLIGRAAGSLGDRASLGFLAETESQVERHLHDHLQRLPGADARSAAVLEQMASDEASHATRAREQGAVPLPSPVSWCMRRAARVMTRSAYWL